MCLLLVLSAKLLILTHKKHQKMVCFYLRWWYSVPKSTTFRASLICYFFGLPVLVPLPASIAFASSTNTLAPGYATWDETSLLMNAGSNKPMICHEELNNFHGNEGMHTSFIVVCLISIVYIGCTKWNFPPLIMLYDVTDSADIGSKGITLISNSSLSGVGNSTRMLLTSEIPKQGRQAPVLHGNLRIYFYFFFAFICRLNLVMGGDMSFWSYFSHRFARLCWSLQLHWKCFWSRFKRPCPEAEGNGSYKFRNCELNKTHHHLIRWHATPSPLK